MLNAPRHVAIIDDEPDVCRALSRLLRVSNYSASSFLSGESFLASLLHSKPDCIVLDMNLPGLNGLAVIEVLRTSHFNVPVIVITGAISNEIERRALGAGALRVLMKPFDDDVVLGAISAATSHFSDP